MIFVQSHIMQCHEGITCYSSLDNMEMHLANGQSNSWSLRGCIQSFSLPSHFLRQFGHTILGSRVRRDRDLICAGAIYISNECICRDEGVAGSYACMYLRIKVCL